MIRILTWAGPGFDQRFAQVVMSIAPHLGDSRSQPKLEVFFDPGYAGNEEVGTPVRVERTKSPYVAFTVGVPRKGLKTEESIAEFIFKALRAAREKVAATTPRFPDAIIRSRIDRAERSFKNIGIRRASESEAAERDAGFVELEVDGKRQDLRTMLVCGGVFTPGRHPFMLRYRSADLPSRWAALQGLKSSKHRIEALAELTVFMPRNKLVRYLIQNITRVNRSPEGLIIEGDAMDLEDSQDQAAKSKPALGGGPGAVKAED